MHLQEIAVAGRMVSPKAAAKSWAMSWINPSMASAERRATGQQAVGPQQHGRCPPPGRTAPAPHPGGHPGPGRRTGPARRGRRPRRPRGRSRPTASARPARDRPQRGVPLVPGGPGRTSSAARCCASRVRATAPPPAVTEATSGIGCRTYSSASSPSHSQIRSGNMASVRRINCT